MDYDNDMIINMADFLYNYLGITQDNIFSITHDDVRILLPDLKRSSFSFIRKNLNEIYNGNIVIVKDPKGEVVPYYNPLRYLDLDIEDLDILLKPSYQKKEEKSITSLANYELKKEYTYAKRKHKYGMCRILKKEIMARGIKKQPKKRYLIDKLKGEIDND